MSKDLERGFGNSQDQNFWIKIQKLITSCIGLTVGRKISNDQKQCKKNKMSVIFNYRPQLYSCILLGGLFQWLCASYYQIFLGIVFGKMVYINEFVQCAKYLWQLIPDTHDIYFA